MFLKTRENARQDIYGKDVMRMRNDFAFARVHVLRKFKKIFNHGWTRINTDCRQGNVGQGNGRMRNGFRVFGGNVS